MKAILMSLSIVSLIFQVCSACPVNHKGKTFYVFKANSLSEEQVYPHFNLRPIEPIIKKGEFSMLKCRNDSDFTLYIRNGYELSNVFTFTSKEERNLVWKNLDPVMIATTDYYEFYNSDTFREAANIWRTAKL
jgi:hypothetical protein